MKKTLLLFATSFTTLFVSAQNFGAGLNYNADIPLMSAMPKMSMNNGGGATLFFKPVEDSRFSVVSDLSAGCFAYKTIKQDYIFTDGGSTSTNVNYSSNMMKALLGFQLDFGKRNDACIPYLRVQGGYNFMNSKIYIEDPSDPDGCKALENRITFSNGNFIYSLGGGLLINLKRYAGNEPPKNNHHYIDISLSYLGGSRAQYVNVNYMTDTEHGVTNGCNMSSMPGTRDLDAKFVNVSTNNVHEHKIAEVYTSPFKMINFKIGYVFLF